MIKRKPFIRKLRPVPTNCPFCHSKTNPNFKDIDVLQKHISERGKIIGKDRTGLCTKHQTRLTVAIKRARFLALLPFVSQVR